jgi:hypothetical protein
MEELNVDKVVESKCLLNYLQSYGPLSALIFSRTQHVSVSIDDEDVFDDGCDLSELMYLSLSTDIMDYMKFVQRVLSFYEFNFDQATQNLNRSAK